MIAMKYNAYRALIEADIDWLRKQPDSLEKRHIEEILIKKQLNNGSDIIFTELEIHKILSDYYAVEKANELFPGDLVRQGAFVRGISEARNRIILLTK